MAVARAGRWYHTAGHREPAGPRCGSEDAVGVGREREPGDDGEWCWGKCLHGFCVDNVLLWRGWYAMKYVAGVLFLSRSVVMLCGCRGCCVGR